MGRGSENATVNEESLVRSFQAIAHGRGISRLTDGERLGRLEGDRERLRNSLAAGLA
jgi:hypothetical protein